MNCLKLRHSGLFSSVFVPESRTYCTGLLTKSRACSSWIVVPMRSISALMEEIFTKMWRGLIPDLYMQALCFCKAVLSEWQNNLMGKLG